MNMKSLKLAVCAAALTVGLGMAATTQANAQAAVMKECGDEYSSAKIGGTLGGKTWPQYLADCKLRKATPVAAPAPAPAPVVVAPKPAAPPVAVAPKPAPAPAPAAATGTYPAAQAGVSHQSTCGAYWRANKASLQAATPGLKWPQYWSGCAKALKGT